MLNNSGSVGTESTMSLSVFSLTLLKAKCSSQERSGALDMRFRLKFHFEGKEIHLLIHITVSRK